MSESESESVVHLSKEAERDVSWQLRTDEPALGKEAKSSQIVKQAKSYGRSHIAAVSGPTRTCRPKQTQTFHVPSQMRPNKNDNVQYFILFLLIWTYSNMIHFLKSEHL